MNLLTACRKFGELSSDKQIIYNDLGILRVDDNGRTASLIVSGEREGMNAGEIVSELQSLPDYYNVEIAYCGGGDELEKIYDDGRIA